MVQCESRPCYTNMTWFQTSHAEHLPVVRRVHQQTPQFGPHGANLPFLLLCNKSRSVSVQLYFAESEKVTQPQCSPFFQRFKVLLLLYQFTNIWGFSLVQTEDKLQP